MSVGVALTVKLAKQAASVFPDADIEIIEKHHNRKKDAPSGTALMIAKAVAEAANTTEFVYGRSGQKEMGHVFHLKCKLETAALCNDEQCAFFRAHMAK